jgi:hypothetical protein
MRTDTRQGLTALLLTLTLTGIGLERTASAQTPSNVPAAPATATATGAATTVATAAQTPGLASEVNEALPDWIRFGGEYRLRWESRTGIAGKDGQDDGYALSRLRLDLTFKLGDHWKVFLQGQDSQAFAYNPNPDPTSVENDFDLRQAYVEYRQREKTGWAVRAGRQEFNYGDQRLVGGLNWGNTARSFDAVKVSWSDARFAVDTFASSVVAIQDGAFDRHLDGQNFYGTHATFYKAVPKAELNTYVFWKTAPFVLDERARAGDADTVTFGGRLAGKVLNRADYALELMGQRGTFSGDDIRGAAAHGRFSYALTAKPTAPKLRAEYNFASGDANPGDGVRGTFDQLYPTNFDKYGIVDQIGLRNMHNARFGVTQKPHPKVTVDVDYNSYWLAHKRDGLYNAAGVLVARIPAGAPGSHVAHEANALVSFAVRDGLTVGAGYGYWFPGAFWKAATPGAGQSFAYTQFAYRF